VTLTFDLLTLKVVSESRVTWAISASFGIGLSVLDLDPMYATDRWQTDRRQTASLLNDPHMGLGHNNNNRGISGFGGGMRSTAVPSLPAQNGPAR